MIRPAFALLVLAVASLCTTARAESLPQIINVSAFDPKERQRSGKSFSEHDVSALRTSGASALIARAGKGGVLDEKCGNFLAAADRAE